MAIRHTTKVVLGRSDLPATYQSRPRTRVATQSKYFMSFSFSMASAMGSRGGGGSIAAQPPFGSMSGEKDMFGSTRTFAFPPTTATAPGHDSSLPTIYMYQLYKCVLTLRTHHAAWASFDIRLYCLDQIAVQSIRRFGDASKLHPDEHVSRAQNMSHPSQALSLSRLVLDWHDDDCSKRARVSSRLATATATRRC